MRRQGQYVDSGVNPLVAAQMQHMSAQRMQHNHLPARSDSLPIDDEHKYIASKAEAQWQWDRNGPKGSNPLSSHLYKEGQASDASRSLFQGQRLESRSSLEKQANKDLRAQSHEQDMEVGYEENSPAQTFEGLEKKFLDEIMKLAKEQQEAEDAEIARHREEKLMSIRSRQTSEREEFLRRESQVRQHQYQQARLSHYHNKSTGPSDPHAYPASGALEETHRAYAAGGQFDSYRERSQFLGGGRNHGGFESTRGPYPGGRAYDSGSRYY
ncbi:uncharacterized protein LOC143885096 isoform X2 [Tasmannia lanceolata]|uniref:uncharacterized protein LOC143885096 isoform X2 n=1 Tax=Tasmannia lanceolata TaxID=3420 RepID=UPI0040632921